MESGLGKYKVNVQKIIRFYNGKNFQSGYFPYFSFSICETDKIYPIGYICNLPCKKYDFRKSKTFVEAFPNIDRVQFALELLNQALVDYSNDPDIVKAVQNRISALSKKPLAICRGCGAKFESGKSNYCEKCNIEFKREREEKAKIA